MFSGGYALCQGIDGYHIVNFEKKIPTIATKNTTQTIIIPQKVKDDSFLSGLYLKSDLYAIYSVVVNPEQEKYDDFLSGDIPYDTYVEYVKQRNVDTTLLTKNFMEKNKFHLYVGLDKANKEKIVIVDCNNNLDFSDDKQYVFSLKDYDIDSYSEKQDSLCPKMLIEVSYYDGVECLPTTIGMSLNPFEADYRKEHYMSLDEYYLNVIMVTNYYMEGNIKINGYNVSVFEHKSNTTNLISNKLNQNSTFRFFIENELETHNNFHVGDTVLIAGKKVYLKNIDGMRLYLEDLNVYADSSKISSQLPYLSAKDLHSNKDIILNDLIKNKYVLIDFWGSWCNPCIAFLPQLADLYERIKNRDEVMILGVSLEHEKDIEKLKKIIKANGIEWINVWSPYSQIKSLQSVHGKLGIEQFPTYYIINKNGEIVYNSKSYSGTDRGEKAINFFLKLIE